MHYTQWTLVDIKLEAVKKHYKKKIFAGPHMMLQKNPPNYVWQRVTFNRATEEKPVGSCASSACWSKFRRVGLVIGNFVHLQTWSGPARPIWPILQLTSTSEKTSSAIVTRCRSESTISRNLLLTGGKPLIIPRIQLLLLPVRRMSMNEKESDGKKNLPPRIQQTPTLKTKLKVLKRYKHWTHTTFPQFFKHCNWPISNDRYAWQPCVLSTLRLVSVELRTLISWKSGNVACAYYEPSKNLLYVLEDTQETLHYDLTRMRK